MEVLILEDDPSRIKKFLSYIPNATVTETAEDCIIMLNKKEWHYLLLDHDLGGEIYVSPEIENTGSGVVRWIIQNRPRIDNIIVHSLNTVASKNMVDDLVRYEYNAVRAPFLYINFDVLSDLIENNENL